MRSNHWTFGLLQAMKEPDKVVISTRDLVAIKDKYPKAKHHFLVIPRADIDSVLDLTSDNIDMLRDMESLARNVVEINSLSIDGFKTGYHAIPTMHRLHLHVISRDFDSPHLTRSRYNSYNTPFLLSTQYVIDHLMRTGKVPALSDQKMEEYLSTPLKCYSCDAYLSNIPKLQEHLATHVGSNESK